MYKLSTELLEYIAERLQINEYKPNFEVKIYRKMYDGTFEISPNRLKDIISIDIDRRWNMATDECSINMWNDKGVYSPDYSPSKIYTNVEGLEHNGYKNTILPFNLLEVDLGYGNEIRRMFTGFLQDVDISENSPTISLNCKNEFRKLLKPIDPVNTMSLKYENKPAFEIILDLCKRAGINSVSFDATEIDNFDFSINKAVFEMGTQYSDAIKNILDTMNHRIFADRLGNINIIQKEMYNQQSFHNWEFDDCVNLTQGNYKMDTSILRNRIIVKSKNSIKAFEDKFLIDYCNGEKISMLIEVPWADELEQKWAVADALFIEMRRKMRRLTYGIIGNPSMDIGDLVKMSALTSTSNGKYMIVGIRSSFSSSGYIDLVDLEYVSNIEGHICEVAEGDYLSDEDDIEDTGKIVVKSKRDEIVETAKKYQGVYYQWGGDFLANKRHYGFDCSHFTYEVLKEYGLMSSYKIASAQYKMCTKISKGELQKGDLVFYTRPSGGVNHVGMYIGDGKAISASGGDQSVTTKAKARDIKAMVKIHPLDYRKNVLCGRVPGM